MIPVPSDFPDRRVCVLGLGYVGLTLAVTMAEIGFEVLGVEVRPDVVERLRKGEAHFTEPGLEQRLAQLVGEDRLRVEETIPDTAPASVYIITVGTPLDSDGHVRLDMIERAAGEVARVLRDGDLVILRSTVRVSTTNQVVRPVLEKSGRRFSLAFCPERTLEGKALEELRELPQIVGGADDAAATRAAQLFQFVTPTVVRVRDAETAEVVKLVDNTYRDVRFAFGNEVARLCDALGVSAAEVVRSGRLGYPRTDVPLPGPVGGPCLEKDPHILVQSVEPMGLSLEITAAARCINERQPSEIADFVHGALGDFQDGAPVIALLGLAFKGTPATDDIRGTMARPIRDELARRFPGAVFQAYDAEVPAEVIRDFGARPCTTPAEAFTGASAVVILNNHRVFSQLPLDELCRGMASPSLVYDCWNLFSSAALRLPPGVSYVALGSHAHVVGPFSANGGGV